MTTTGAVGYYFCSESRVSIDHSRLNITGVQCQLGHPALTVFSRHNGMQGNLLCTQSKKTAKAKIKLEGSLENAHCAENSSKLICLASLENGEVLIWVSGTGLLRQREAVAGRDRDLVSDGQIQIQLALSPDPVSLRLVE